MMNSIIGAGSTDFFLILAYGLRNLCIKIHLVYQSARLIANWRGLSALKGFFQVVGKGNLVFRGT